MAKTKRNLCCITNPISSKGFCKQCLVRNRRTYDLFKQYAEAAPHTYDTLYHVWQEKERMWSWKTSRNSRSALESLKQVAVDLKLKGAP